MIAVSRVALGASEAEARAAAAHAASGRVRDEMRRAVGAERERVAGMVYREALQAHTLEEQARPLGPISG